MDGWMKQSLFERIKPSASFYSLPSMQNEWNWCRLLFRPLTKFAGKVRKIFWAQPFRLSWILYHFISSTNEIFCLAWISQLLRSHNKPFKVQSKSCSVCQKSYLSCLLNQRLHILVTSIFMIFWVKLQPMEEDQL